VYSGGADFFAQASFFLSDLPPLLYAEEKPEILPTAA